jgi:hypothetical protein
MQVVAVVHHRVNALRAAALDVRAIDRRRFLVRLHRRRIISRADVNMRRHMHDVSRRRSQRSQPVRRRQRPFRRIRRLHGVNVVMERTQMVRIAFHHRFQSCDNLLRAVLRRPVTMPQSPRMQVHPRLREQRRRIQIVGIVLHHLAHRVPIFFRGLPQIGLRIRRKAFRHRQNIAAFRVGGIATQVHRLLNRIMRPLEAVCARRIVVVRSHRLRNSPVRHRQFRIECRRFLKRARRLVMVERVDQAQSLIEKPLRFRVLRRNRMMQIAQARHHRDRLRFPHGVILCGGTDREKDRERENDRKRERGRQT